MKLHKEVNTFHVHISYDSIFFQVSITCLNDLITLLREMWVWNRQVISIVWTECLSLNLQKVNLSNWLKEEVWQKNESDYCAPDSPFVSLSEDSFTMSTDCFRDEGSDTSGKGLAVLSSLEMSWWFPSRDILLSGECSGGETFLPEVMDALAFDSLSSICCCLLSSARRILSSSSFAVKVPGDDSSISLSWSLLGSISFPFVASLTTFPLDSLEGLVDSSRGTSKATDLGREEVLLLESLADGDGFLRTPGLCSVVVIALEFEQPMMTRKVFRNLEVIKNTVHDSKYPRSLLVCWKRKGVVNWRVCNLFFVFVIFYDQSRRLFFLFPALLLFLDIIMYWEERTKLKANEDEEGEAGEKYNKKPRFPWRLLSCNVTSFLYWTPSLCIV